MPEYPLNLPRWKKLSERPLKMVNIDYEKYHHAIERVDLVKVIGKVIQVVGLIIEAQVQGVSIGDLCTIRIGKEEHETYAEAVGFREGRVLLMPLGTTTGISPGSQVVAAGHPLKVKVGPKLLGRILGGLGEPIDDKGPIEFDTENSLDWHKSDRRHAYMRQGTAYRDICRFRRGQKHSHGHDSKERGSGCERDIAYRGARQGSARLY